MHTSLYWLRNAQQRGPSLQPTGSPYRHTTRYALILVAATCPWRRWQSPDSTTYVHPINRLVRPLRPWAIGAVLAYLLNFIAAALNRVWFPYQQQARHQDAPPHLASSWRSPPSPLRLRRRLVVGGEFKSAGARHHHRHIGSCGHGVAGHREPSRCAGHPDLGQRHLELHRGGPGRHGRTDQALRIGADQRRGGRSDAFDPTGHGVRAVPLLDKDRVHAGAITRSRPSQRGPARRVRTHAASPTTASRASSAGNRGGHLGCPIAYGGSSPVPLCGFHVIVGVSSLIHSRKRMDIGGIMGAAMIYIARPR